MTVDAATRERLDAEAGPVVEVPVVALDGHPLDHAVYATGTGDNVYVMGTDRTQRQLVTDAGGRGALRPSSLDDDATHLAIIVPGGLMVADLPEATTTTYRLPPRLMADPDQLELAWIDESRVHVAGASGPVVVDLDDGTVADHDGSAFTAYAPTGSVTWGSSFLAVDGEQLQALAVATGEGPPLVGPGYAVSAASASVAALRGSAERRAGG